MKDGHVCFGLDGLRKPAFKPYSSCFCSTCMGNYSMELQYNNEHDARETVKRLDKIRIKEERKVSAQCAEVFRFDMSRRNKKKM